ncbi:MAG TPA: FHA domain-containing protein [Moraxellaceae bacterium]|nr:FHA domain-containing protein [Moraxellaceae bacterium]
MLKLQFLDNRQPSMWLVDPRISIGRDKSNSLVINDEGVSVFHAEIRQEDGKVFIWDSGSVNGTFVNGEKVTGKREVQAGDVIRFHLIDVQLIDPSKGPAPELPAAVKRDLEKAAQPQWQVKAMTGTISGKMFLVDGTKIIGRDPGCDIIISGAHVSRRHAELSMRGGKLWVKDLGSSNGTFVNGKRTEEVQLRNGDEVKFDAMTFKIVGPAEAEDSFEEAEMTQFRPAIAKPAAAPAPKPAAPAPAPAAAAPAPAPKPVPAPAAAPAPAAPKPAPAPAPQAAPAPAPRPAAAAPAAAPKPAAKPAAPAPRPAPAAATAAPAKSGGSTGLIIGAVVVAIAVAAALLFFVK